MEDNPKISIVMPCFKARETIEASILSVVTQDYQNIELILLDGAGDDSWKVIKKYENHLAYWRSHPDDGQYAAIVEGFSYATGDIFYWLNADDLLLPKALSIVAAAFAKYSAVQWLCTLRPGIWDTSGRLLDIQVIQGFAKHAFLDGFFTPSLRKRGRFIPQDGTFFRRELWQRAGNAICKADLAGDFALWCEMYKSAELVGLQYPVSGFRVRRGQRSEDQIRYLLECERELKILRSEVNWPEWRPAARLMDFGLSQIPKIRSWAQNIGYNGRVIESEDVRDPNLHLQLRDYTWLP